MKILYQNNDKKEVEIGLVVAWGIVVAVDTYHTPAFGACKWSAKKIPVISPIIMKFWLRESEESNQN